MNAAGEKARRSVALVTGAAGGLGSAIAERIAADHDALVLTDVATDRLAEVADKVAGTGTAVAHVRCDVRSGADVRAAFDLAQERFGPVTSLVNVAGKGGFTPFTALTEQQWDDSFAINTKGTFLTCQEFVRRAEGAGAVVNIASIGARLGMELLAHYGPAKAAVIELTHVVARVGAPRGIRANAVMPGMIWTDMWRESAAWLAEQGDGAATAEELFGGFVEQMIPMQRPQTGDDIAEAVAFLLSDRAANVTGQTLSVDGGAVMT